MAKAAVTPQAAVMAGVVYVYVLTVFEVLVYPVPPQVSVMVAT
jgi:hypothetical protein